MLRDVLPAEQAAGGTPDTLRGRAILQVIPRLDAGGAERTTLEVVQALVAVGARALVASEGGRMEVDIKASGGELCILPKLSSKNPLTLLANRRRIAGLVDAHAVSLVHARSRAPAWSALWATRRTGTAFVTTYHGTYNARSGLKRFYNSVMARGDIVIANSDFTREHLIAQHGTAPGRVVTIPRGIDPIAFTDEAVSSARIGLAAAHAGLDLSAPLPRVLLPGRLTAWKGQMQFIEALADCQAQGLAFQAAIVGDAQGREGYVEDLRRAIAASGLDGTIMISPHFGDVAALFKAADIVAAPSQEPEAFGRIAIEAQAAGRPVLVCDHGGQRETVEQGVTGLRVPPGNRPALAQGLAQLLRMPATERRQMGQRGQARVSRLYTVDALQQATLAVYRRVLEARA